MKKVMTLCAVFLFAAVTLQAQSTYKSAIGLRLGGGYYDIVAGSLKTFISKPGALEFNLGIRPYGYIGNNWVNVSASASYQHHFPIGNIDGFKWFVGGGLTVYNSFSDNRNYRGVGVGLFPTGGVDYKFAKIPLNVSADIRPTISVVTPYSHYNSFHAGNGGIAVRYTFR